MARLQDAKQHTWADPWQSISKASPHESTHRHPYLSLKQELGQQADHAMLLRADPKTLLSEKSVLPGKIMNLFAGKSWSLPELGLPWVFRAGCAHKNTGRPQQTQKWKQLSILDVVGQFFFPSWCCLFEPQLITALFGTDSRGSHLQAVSSTLAIGKHEDDC